MKSLQLVTEPPLGEGQYVTFAFFGKTGGYVEKDDLLTLAPFTLRAVGPAMRGRKKKKEVMVLLPTTEQCRAVRQKVLSEQPYWVEALNYPNWSPHVSGGGPYHDSYRVVGVKSDDGSFHFSLTN
jgi:hypothetical protein